ncbi:MAG: carbohydrate-binding domain-containing protein [Clostridiales bacterium]|nr:carbohydrate-binding domain-containing protein [Clostridiales bacterium]
MSYKHTAALIFVCIIASMFTASALFGCSDSGNYDDTEKTEIVKPNDNGDTVIELDNKNVTISEAGTYVIRGSLADGQIKVEADKADKVTLILDGVDISCKSSAAIYIKQADKVTIELASGSNNRVAVIGDFKDIDENNIDAAIFSKEDLSIKGDGKLTVESVSGNGVTSKDDLIIESGTLDITAIGHALEAKDLIEVSGGAVTINAGKDGLHAENKDNDSLGGITISGGIFDMICDGDGIDAAYSLKISGGEFIIKSGGGSPDVVISTETFGRFGQNTQTGSDSTSTKGIKAGGDITITGGIFELDTADDALHSNANLTIKGGSFVISTGDDAVHSDETLTIDDGIITINKSYEGLEGDNVEINGGEISLVAADDGINAAGGNDSSGFGGGFKRDNFGGSDSKITINGGIIYVNAAGDGVDSNGNLYINGGELYISGPTDSMNGAIDYESIGEVNGGIVFAAGASGMAQSFNSSDSKQPSMLVSFNGSISGEIVLYNFNGDKLASFTPDKSYQCVVISHPDLKIGEKYTVAAGNQTVEVSLDSITVGNGFGGFGGFGGNRHGDMNMPDMRQPDNGDMPKIPNGEIPTIPNDGQFPQMPDNGEMPPMMGGGNMPDMQRKK